MANRKYKAILQHDLDGHVPNTECVVEFLANGNYLIKFEDCCENTFSEGDFRNLRGSMGGIHSYFDFTVEITDVVVKKKTGYDKELDDLKTMGYRRG